MTHSPVRFGVLGTGRITRRLIADLQSTPGASVSAIASRSGDRAKWSADSHGIAAAVEGYAELLARDDVDAVYIALPPSLHHEWTLAACQAGKHVLCEKPVALSAAQVSEMIAAANSADVRFLDATAWLHHERTDQFRQWLTTTGPQEDSAKAAAKKDDLFDDESESDDEAIPFRLGPLRHLSASVSFPNPFLDGDHRLHASLGGGALLDLGWYSAGLIRFASGVLPKEVYAQAVMRGEIVARVSATMIFYDELTATLSCGFDTSTRKWFEIAGTDASIVCDDFTRPWAEKPARSWVHEASGKVHSFVPPSEVNVPAEPNSAPEGGVPVHRCLQERVMIGTLVRWIREGAPSGQPAPWNAFHEQALHTQTMLDALDESIRRKQPVSLG
ncbi:putative dehydrogenase [Rhodopirellula rubra]|uniref:Putative dehydrogenase n=1 Tax=Aporhodopirellula rubra TaxID=980271 RepID=A0A7W5E3L9_9BACT|nr:Gfo/Idh/MocA family oxidoreductase [Aporhodopirellula rubra]MBB3208712.1 putative dehydrogenase [Aporhodopirellula rubra]